ncbi:MAG: acetylglutamate kinase [Alphaproteobacteria bacterium]|nr:acetylglutamate kinase [Alphaproteobacteria bacterium]
MPPKKQKSDTKKATAWLKKAHMLTESLPFMQFYDNKTVVIKYGGHAMGDAKLADLFARDVVLLKQAGVNPIIVHGGGPQINGMLEKLGIKAKFAHGLRVTDSKTMEVVEMVLAGAINKRIVASIHNAGGQAVGLSGKDGQLLIAKKKKSRKIDPASHVEKLIDLGFAGEPSKVNTEILETLINSAMIPVIAPIGVSARGQTLNVNADIAAGAIAGAMKAERLLLLTDVVGVQDKKSALIERLTIARAKKLIKDGTARDGMIPKLETAIAAHQKGVRGVAILDGRVAHAILLELFTELGAGTLVE